MADWEAGQRVWYEPSPGMRFAGVVVSSPESNGQCEVMLTAHHSLWQKRGSHVRVRPSTEASSLTLRLGEPVVDADTCYAWSYMGSVPEEGE